LRCLRAEPAYAFQSLFVAPAPDPLAKDFLQFFLNGHRPLKIRVRHPALSPRRSGGHSGLHDRDMELGVPLG
jgi:hypothetical protein